MKTKILGKAFSFVILALTLIPIIYILAISFTVNIGGEMRVLSFNDYKAFLLENPIYNRLFLNSLLTVIPVVLFNSLISLFCAYGLLLSKKTSVKFIFPIYFICIFLPVQTLIVPQLLVANTLNISGSLLALVLPAIFSPLASCLIYLKMRDIPKAYLDYARVEGASKLKILKEVVFPYVWQVFSLTAFLTFIEFWSILEQALVFKIDGFSQPLSVRLSYLVSDGSPGGYAASVFYMLLPILIFAFVISLINLKTTLGGDKHD